MDNVLFSIITPNYNGEKYLKYTIEAVLAQTLDDWEMLIVDDCSTDNSVEIIENYAAKDSRIKLFKHEKNSGAAAARNSALKTARGKYIAFCDGDDIWHPQKLEKQLAFMKENDYAFSFTEFCIINAENELTKQRVICPKKVNYLNLVTGNPIMCSSVIINREIVGDFEMPPIWSAQDYATWAMIMKDRRFDAYCLKEVLAKYRKAGSSLSSNKIKAFKRTWKINRDYLHMNFFKNSAVVAVYAVRWIIKHYL